ncbi:DUF2975 domain-containing protein [Streptomyces sp. NPDC051907]|uniref:DUF2975 domain-containing protein n=1 Tax=Streptomyces sp. NPDC051907 TaxID=3155284 RepID=UPI003437CCF0
MTEPTGTCVGAPPKEDGPDCPECGNKHRLQPGSRSWFWAKRAEHATLFFIPAIPASRGVTEFVRPQASITLTGGQHAELNKTFEASGAPSTVERVIVHLDAPTLAERAAAAGPSLLLAGLLAFVAYALWRIEINMTSGRKQRPFTEKDGRVLGRSAGLLMWGWLVVIVAELAGFGVLRFGSAEVETGLAGIGSDASLVVLGLGVLVGVMARVYRKGAKAYEDLEKIV